MVGRKEGRKKQAGEYADLKQTWAKWNSRNQISLAAAAAFRSDQSDDDDDDVDDDVGHKFRIVPSL